MMREQPQSALMPDGEAFALWEDETNYTRIYYVDQAHPDASDDNAGTVDRPLMTIGEAARRVGPAEKVVVRSGVYREQIAPARGGLGPDQMVCFEAAPGAQVVVKGSRVLDAAWERTIGPSGNEYSFRLWRTPLPETLFPYETNPFDRANASDEEIDLMPWALEWKGRIPYTLVRGLVFQNGRRMVQLGLYEDLTRLPGSYWVDRAGGMLYMHPFDGADPRDQCYEVTVQEHLLKPEQKGLGYIIVRGFTFEHAGNGFPRIGVGAVYVYGGHHWIIEDNTVRHCNSVGIEAGARIAEVRASSDEENARAEAHEGGFIVRNNTVYDCGTGGIEGHTVRDSLIQRNHIHHIGWQDAERYWECAAIKTLRNEGVLVRGNLIHDVESASAIWLDWDNRNCRITQNILRDINHTHNGAIFIEASQHPNLIDHNIIWGAWEIGVSLFDTDQARVYHNLIAHAGTPVVARVNTDRSLHGRPLTSRGNGIRNNILYADGAPPLIENSDNTCDANAYIGEMEEPRLSARVSEGWDEHSSAIAGEMNLCGQVLYIELAQPLPTIAPAGPRDGDLLGQEVPEQGATPGPIQAVFQGKTAFRLWD